MPGYSFGRFWYDISLDQLLEAGQLVRLDSKERKLLRLLLSAYNKPVSEDRITEELWGEGKALIDSVKRNIAVRKSSIKVKAGEEIIKRTDCGEYCIAFPVVYRDNANTSFADTLPEITQYLAETRYGISPIGEYLPIYPSYAGLARDEVEVLYEGEYEPSADFLKLMKRFPPEPPVNHLYSFHGWKGEIPSEDELAGSRGKKVVFCLQGGTWHHVHTLSQIRNASDAEPPDGECRRFRVEALRRLIPIRTSGLYHNVNTEALVVTADEKIVMARRKSSVVLGGTWTASLEEQMLRYRQKDGFSDKADLFACAERGARAELGITVISNHTRLLSVGIEFGNFTAAFLVLIRSAETFEEIARRTWPNASECDEAVALDAISAQPEALTSILRDNAYNPCLATCVRSPRWTLSVDPASSGPWHPVAKARLDAYVRHIAKNNDAT